MNRKDTTTNIRARRIAVLLLTTALALTGAAAGAQALDWDVRLDTLVPAQTDGDAVGAATATFPGCPDGSDIVVLMGSGSGGSWTFSYDLVSGCDGYSNSGSASGTWDSAEGGCLEPANQICLSEPNEIAPGVIEYVYVNNLEFHSGSATLVIA